MPSVIDVLLNAGANPGLLDNDHKKPHDRLDVQLFRVQTGRGRHALGTEERVRMEHTLDILSQATAGAAPAAEEPSEPSELMKAYMWSPPLLVGCCSVLRRPP